MRGDCLADLIREYARDLRRNSSGGDLSEDELAEQCRLADYLEGLIKRAAKADAELDADMDRALSEEEMATIDRLVEDYAGAAPVAKVIDNNQTGRTAIIEILRDPPTLEVGALLYATPQDLS